MYFVTKLFSKSRPKKDGIFFDSIRNLISFSPKNLDIYKKAFIHRSSNIFDEKGMPINYERLEFLGDAMLSAVIAAYLYGKAPLGNEGYLTKMRSKIVSREYLNKLGKELNLLSYVETKIPAARFGENIYGNLFEALVGAIYLDRGYDYCKIFIDRRVILSNVDFERLEEKIISYKSLIIEWCQKKKKTFEYQFTEDSNPDGERFFCATLRIDKEVYAKARETSKKKAEEKASRRAYFKIQKSLVI